MKRFAHRFLYKKERGQAIILVAFGLIGLIAMVGLVIDTGILFIEYGKLKRGVDAAAIAAAQEFRSVSGGGADPVAMRNAAINYLQLNEADVDPTNISVHSCLPTDPARPKLCNPLLGDPVKNRKLVELSASKFVSFSFLRIIGIKGTTISTSAIGEAATMDLVLIVDTSSSMAYETSGNLLSADPGDDPSVCNYPTDTCQPMKAIKTVAENFINTMYFPYDRVAIVTMTSQTAGGDREALTILPLSSDQATVVNAIKTLKVFQPRNCPVVNGYTNTPGPCAQYNSAGVYQKTICEIWEWQSQNGYDYPDPSSCNSSDVGSTLLLARAELTGGGAGGAVSRPESFWAVVGLYGGPANSSRVVPNDPQFAAIYSTVIADFPFGFCPKTTWVPESPQQRNYKVCRDRLPGEGVGRRHAYGESVSYQNPRTPLKPPDMVSVYDADDFARDKADALATTITGGVTIYTIGLGAQVQSVNTVDNGEPAPAENLLQYVSETAGGVNITHGKYFYAPTSSALGDIFELIANNIATRISQ